MADATAAMLHAIQFGGSKARRYEAGFALCEALHEACHDCQEYGGAITAPWLRFQLRLSRESERLHAIPPVNLSPSLPSGLATLSGMQEVNKNERFRATDRRLDSNLTASPSQSPEHGDMRRRRFPASSDVECLQAPPSTSATCCKPCSQGLEQLREGVCRLTLG